MKPSRRIEMRSNSIKRGLLCASVLALVCLAGTARADANADSERANLLFKKGKVAFNDGKYTDALRIYGEAWGLKQSPDIAANLAQTEAELGKHRDAAEHFAFALAHLLPSSTDEQKKALAEGLEIEKREVSTLHVTLEPADALLAVDDAPVALPPNGEVFVDAGDHHAVVSREGYETNSQTLHVSKGSAQVLWIKLPEQGAAAPAPAPAPVAAPVLDTLPPKLDEGSPRSLVPAVIGGGLVVAGAAVGVVFLLSANSSQKDANQVAGSLPGNNACGAGTPHTADCATLHDDNKDIDRSRTIELTGFAVAGAAAVGTLVYLLWPHSIDAATARSLTPSFSAAPGLGSLNLTGRF
jgi:hypothetical protein